MQLALPLLCGYITNAPSVNPPPPDASITSSSNVVPRGRGQWLDKRWHRGGFQLGANPERSEWHKKDMKSEWLTCVGTGEAKLLYEDDVVRNCFLFFFCHVSPIICLHADCSWFDAQRTFFHPCAETVQFCAVQLAPHFFLMDQLKTKLLHLSTHGLSCWCGRWGFPHQPELWLIYDNHVTLIAVKYQREARKISVKFDPLPSLQQMALKQHSVAWCPIRAAR